MAWRLAKSLEVYRAQCDVHDPNRDKSSDGTIASRQHTRNNPSSDHEPNEHGVVTALDITAPLGHEAIEDARVSRDRRVKYGISRGRIFSSYLHRDGPPFEWRPYSGSNQHHAHAHLSVVGDPALYDDPRQWEILQRKDEDMPVTDPGGVYALQRILSTPTPSRPDKGIPYDIGEPDGVLGPKTRAAIQDWQNRRGWAVTGEFDLMTVQSLHQHVLLARMDAHDHAISGPKYAS